MFLSLAMRNWSNEFTPKFFSMLREGISRQQISRDILSGLIVGIIALPLAIAFAIASGVSPERGLITAVVAGFFISLMGGSRVQIGGPTGAFIIIVLGIVQEHGVAGLITATFMAGILLIGMGFARLGNYLRFVPYTLIVGFTSGIAVIIFSSQIKDFFGLPMPGVPADFLGKWKAYFGYVQQINVYSLSIAAGTVLVALQFHRITRKVPGSIVAIVLSTLVVWWFGLPVDTIESRYGEIPGGLPSPRLPSMDFGSIQVLIQPAIAIALLGAIESLLSAVVADGMTGGRHRSNMELVAQGGANILSSLFGGIPATGAIARTATNVKNGGRTPVSGMTHALVLLLIMVLFAPVAKLIPLACLAGILMVVAWHMGEWHHFFRLLGSNRLDVLVLLVTFFLTVFFDLILAIQIGMVLSSFIFMKRMSETTSFREQGGEVLQDETGRELLFEEELPAIPKGVLLYEINGPLFFGASQKFQEVISDLNQQPKVLILRMRHVPFIDATGLKRLEDIHKTLTSRGTHILISGANPEVRESLLKASCTQGADCIFADIHGALEAARRWLEAEQSP
jgi:sulfate permease, SulP family